MGETSSFLRLRDSTYWFRRRVPRRLTAAVGLTEISRTLETGQRRLAESRARLLFTLTEQIFTVSDELQDMSLAEEEVAPLIRRLRQEPVWESPTLRGVIADIREGRSERLKSLLENGRRLIEQLPEPERQQVLAAAARMLDAQRCHVAALDVQVLKKRAQLERLRGATAQLKADDVALEEVKALGRTFEGLVSTVEDLREQEAARPEGPRFSELQEAFLAERTRGNDHERAWSPDVVDQARMSYRVFVSLVGDMQVAALTRRQVGQFKTDLLDLPTVWGKSSALDLSPREWVEKARASPSSFKTLSAKTAKRHFSALSGFWSWLEQRELVAANVFGGWYKASRKKAVNKVLPFAPEHLVAILESDWFDESEAWHSGRRWVPLIAMWSGMRLEEVVRLRPARDIVVHDGVLCFQVCDHDDGWTPKTEAGVRRVPVHPVLRQFGIERLVERNRASPHLFPEYERHAGRRRGKLGASVTRDFSYLKTQRLKLPKSRVFHSFRHSAVTALHNVRPALARDWIDAVMGHTPGDGESEGRKTYTEGYSIENLKHVVDALNYPDTVMQALERVHRFFAAPDPLGSS